MTCQCGQLFFCPVDMKQVFWRRIRKISSDQSSGSNSHIHHFFLISFWNSKLAIFKSQYFYINIPPTSRVHVFLLPRFFQPPISQKKTTILHFFGSPACPSEVGQRSPRSWQTCREYRNPPSKKQANQNLNQACKQRINEPSQQTQKWSTKNHRIYKLQKPGPRTLQLEPLNRNDDFDVEAFLKI